LVADGGQAYTSQIASYSTLYKPVVTKFTVPGTGGLAGTYQWTTAYYFTGQVNYTQQPAIGDLPQEKVVPGYTYNAALPFALSAGGATVVASTTYDHYGRDTEEDYGAFGQKVYNTFEYDEHTNALTDQFTDRDTAPQRIDHTHYTYDQAQNVTSVTDTTGQDSAAVTDTQCFTTDALRRITQAWTLNTAAACSQGPSSTTVGGPDAYWTSYGYDAVGNRTTETQHTTASGPAVDTTRTYAAPGTGTHDLPQVTQTGTNPHTDTYTYDADGNTHTRTLAGTQQVLTWDPQGHLATVTQGTTTLASYTYDADGNRLTAKDATGTTLYLPGGNELLLKPDNTLVGTRYYGFAGKTVAMRTGGKISFLISDPHGTTTTQIDATTQAVTRRKTTIFGAPRGTTDPGWQGTKGFVGGTTDTATGLTHLGARDYDPTTGRFISVDPLFNASDSQSLNGYAYAENNPTTLSDPAGQCPVDLCGGGEGKGGSTTGEVTKVDKASSVYQPLPWVPTDRDGNVVCSDQCQVFPGVSVPATKAWKKDITRFVTRFYQRFYFNAGMNDPDFMTDWQTNNAAAAQLQLWLWESCAGKCPDKGTMLYKALGLGVAAGWGFPGRDGVLGELSSKRVTTGRIFDSSGNAIHGEIEAGGNSDLVEATDAYLRQHGAPINPRAARYPASQHVETQYAMWMRQNGITDATVVMNNSEGVCGGVYGCQNAIRAILPEGSTMTVWYPGASEPVIIPGEAAAP
jgi:RHS repeat-associated protein